MNVTWKGLAKAVVVIVVIALAVWLLVNLIWKVILFVLPLAIVGGGCWWVWKKVKKGANA